MVPCFLQEVEPLISLNFRKQFCRFLNGTGRMWTRIRQNDRDRYRMERIQPDPDPQHY
jgi:hypothetical protein